MFRKILGGAAVAIAVLAIALPAGAANTKLHASFDNAGPPTDGGATLVLRAHSWWAHLTASGLAPGTYSFRIGVFIDTNHDGIPEGGSSAEACFFTVKAGKSKGGCGGRAHSSIAANFDPGLTPNLFTADLSRVVPNTEILVESATFR